MSKRKRLIQSAPNPASPDAPYGGNDYRVRVMELNMIVDVYDKLGNLLGRVKSPEPIMIAESEFPVDICRLIQAKTELKDGFYCLKVEQKRDTPAA